jgi:uncharacterized protein (TIGR02246 family)
MKGSLPLIMLTILLVAATLQAQADITPSAQSAQAIPADARAAIARANADWLSAMERQDAQAVVEPYADDAVFVPATGESVSGRAAIAQLMRNRFRAGHVVGGELKQDGLVAVGSMIYEWGHANLQMAVAAGGPSSPSTGRYLTVWKRDKAGHWRIIRNLSLGD